MKQKKDSHIIDLSVPVDPSAWEPEPVKRKVIGHREGGDLLGRSLMYVSGTSLFSKVKEWVKHKTGFGMDHRDFPDGKGLSLMSYTLTTHTGTHLDSPFHFSDVDAQGNPMKTVSEIPLEWCFGDGVLLDLSGEPSEDPVTQEEVRAKLSEIGHTLAPFDIVLINTGGDRFMGKPEYFSRFRGITRDATAFMVEQGVKIIGVDSFGFDPPFGKMVTAYMTTKDKDCLWPAHMYGRRHEYCHIERLANLDNLPAATGFKVACFPVNLKDADAAWCRVVAILQHESKR
ncbi:MAG: cyclase family protein [Desulfobacter sp.]